MTHTTRACSLLFLMICLTQGCGGEEEREDVSPTDCKTDSCADDGSAVTLDDMSKDSTKKDMGSTTSPTSDMTTTPSRDMGSAPATDMPAEPAPVCANVSTCQAGDGCCPSSCDATTDEDCAVDCRAPDSWPKNWADEEAALLRQVNIERSKGASCGSKGTFAPAPPVTMNRELQIAARCHSIDMIKRGSPNKSGLDHTGTDGSSFSQRAKREGYTGSPRGENIAAGNRTALATTAQWMKSDGHCSNIMKDDINRMGIGYFTGDVRFTHYWTMVTGKGGE